MTIARTNQEAIKRWQHNRLGMFIHWGLYAFPARHEWVKSQENISDGDYQKYFDNFNPDLYDPAEWAKYARKAGMKYVVLTTKHHEGFCLFESQHTDYKATNTRCGKDLVKMYVDAFRAEGIRIGFYYSLIDWHHPHYTLDIHHPMRNSREHQERDSEKDMSKYAAYLHSQVRELLTHYGEIDFLWLDFSITNHITGELEKGRDAWNSIELVKMVRALQPNILINDRLDLLDVDGGWDFKTPEQIMLRRAPEENGKMVPWETCQTFSGSWGYYRDEMTWKSDEQLIKLLIDTVSKGGNLLLNVGPTARGEFDNRAKNRLDGMGDWMSKNSRSIYGCTQAPESLVPPQDCRLTYNPDTKRIYVHIFSWPPTGELYLDGFGEKVQYAQLLHDGSEIKFGAGEPWQAAWEQEKGAVLSLKLPVLRPDVLVPVIELSVSF